MVCKGPHVCKHAVPSPENAPATLACHAGGTYTPLHYAARAGKLEAVALLLKNGRRSGGSCMALRTHAHAVCVT